MSEVKNIPRLRFPEFQENWEKKRLGDVGKIRMCKRIFNHQTSVSGDIPFFKIGTFGRKPDSYISRKLYNEFKHKYSYPKVGDILISAAGTLGRTVVFDGNPSYFQDSNIVWIDNKENLITNEFLYYIYKIVKYESEGGTIQRLYNSIIYNAKFWKPSFPEQQKIVDFLNAVDKRIGLLEKKKTLLETYKKGVMKRIFNQEIRFKDDNGNDFPDWEEKRLDDVFKSSKGKGLSKDKISDHGRHKAVLYGELYTTYNEVAYTIKSYTDFDEGTKSRVGDLLVPCSTTTSNVDLANVTAIMENDIRLGGDITILRTTGIDIDNIFYSYYLSNHKKYELAKFGQGTTIVHLYFNHFKKLKVDVPSLKEQRKVSNFLSSIDSQIELLEIQIDKSKTWKKGLLQKMFV